MKAKRSIYATTSEDDAQTNPTPQSPNGAEETACCETSIHIANEATVTIEVKPDPNRVPQAFFDAYGTPVNTPLTVSAPGLRANDYDPDGDAIFVNNFTQPTNGTLTNIVTSGAFTYTPNTGVPSTDEFTYNIRDGSLLSEFVTVFIGVGSEVLLPVELTSFEAVSLSYRLKQIDFDGTFEYSPLVEVDLATPEAFAIHENFPNPFTGATTIRYASPRAAHVRLAVYDVLGREVALLVDEEQEAGRKAVSFEPSSSLASGPYLYRLEAGSLRKSGKMILMKE